jgi:hypothetical protein
LGNRRTFGGPERPLLQHERRGDALGDDRPRRIARLLRLDGDLADVDDAGELADLVEEGGQAVVRALRLDPVRDLLVELLLNDLAGLKALDRQIGPRREPWMRRRMSATSFCSGMT